jgi:hypothetical protein
LIARFLDEPIRSSGYAPRRGDLLITERGADLVAIAALASVNDTVREINQRSVATLIALGDLRDMEGDMRVVVRDYVDADAADRADVAKEAADTDRQADADIAAYLTAHGNRGDAQGRLMTSFVGLLRTWRTVRDQQILAPARQGHVDAARDAIAGPLATADDAMATPLDTLFEAETTAANARQATAAHGYTVARVEVLLIIGAGLAASCAVAWLLIRRPLDVLRSVRPSCRAATSPPGWTPRIPVTWASSPGPSTVFWASW